MSIQKPMVGITGDFRPERYNGAALTWFNTGYYDSVSAAKADVADYFSWYNTHRPHSRLERLTPDEKYLAELPPVRLAA